MSMIDGINVHVYVVNLFFVKSYEVKPQLPDWQTKRRFM